MTKSLEIQAKKRLLIVEPPEGKLVAITDNEESFYAVKRNETYIKIANAKTWKFICSGSDLIEEKIRELNIVETKLYGSAYKYGTGKNGFRPGFCAPDGKQFTNSFISAIEAQGWHWGQNPLGDEPKREEYEKDVPVEVWEKDFLIDHGEWKEAESRTFHPEKVLIFEIVEG